MRHRVKARSWWTEDFDSTIQQFNQQYLSYCLRFTGWNTLKVHVSTGKWFSDTLQTLIRVPAQILSCIFVYQETWYVAPRWPDLIGQSSSSCNHCFWAIIEQMENIIQYVQIILMLSIVLQICLITYSIQRIHITNLHVEEDWQYNTIYTDHIQICIMTYLIQRIHITKVHQWEDLQ